MEVEQLIVDYTDVCIANDKGIVLDHVFLKLHQQDFCYLIGKTGSGKSTLIRSMFQDVPIKSGEKAEVLGMDLLSMKKQEIPFLRRKIGMIFQDFQLFQQWSVARNLAYVLRVTGWSDVQKMHARIKEVLSAVHLEDKAKQMVHTLSGGEQQRVAIARAILNEPKLILADEPTGNLDPDTSDDIFYLLREVVITLGTSLFVATHDHRIIQKFPAKTVECIHGSLQH